ncbi:MAG: efflux RND transporter periplasmic adaptor subunit [Pseudomonadales bacterium]|nr:efflux RND transporter periplasmic adaptor subunit [Pseudomonadales bacterium]
MKYTMKNHQKFTGSTAVGMVVGIAVGIGVAVVGNQLLMKPTANMSGMTDSISMKEDKKPLYWVAPMDANYRRDKPGQSPMGMDLIPFYADDGGGNGGPGTVRISPDVVNNLGVRTAVAKRQSMHSEIKTVGYVKYDEDKLLHIHPRVEGWIETLYVKAAGDPVKEGQPLYDIYSPALVNAQEEFVLALGRKNKRIIRAAEDRLTALQLPKSVIRQLKKTKQVKQTITVVAPQSGVVDNMNIREGVFVKPGNTVMSIGSLEQVWVEAEVFERQVFQVSAGLPVTMTLDFLPGKSWLGKVDYVYPTLNAKTRTVKLRLRFDNKSQELKPNMFAEVIIHTKSDGDALLVPREAIIRTGSVDRVVLALGEGRFKSIEVNVGRFDEKFAEIVYGLKEGESVVTSALFLLDSESSKTSDFNRMEEPRPDN